MLQNETTEMAGLHAIFKAVFAAMTDGVILYNLQAKVVEVNAAAEKMLDIHAPDIIGKDIFQFVALFQGLDEKRHPLMASHLPICSILNKKMHTQSQIITVILHLSTGHEVVTHITDTPIYDAAGRLIGGASILRDTFEQQQHESALLRALTSLPTLIEMLTTIPEQSLTDTTDQVSPISAIGKALADVISQVLVYQYVEVLTLEPPDERQHLIGVSGLTSSQQTQLEAEVEQTPLSCYIRAEAIEQLHANQILTIDLQETPFTTPRSDFGTRYRLVAPMVLHNRLIGIFIMAKNEGTYTNINYAYTPEEITLIQGLARMTAILIERVHLLRREVETQVKTIALEESNRRYDAFVTAASHELRTPLTTVRGNIELAFKRLNAFQEQVEAFNLLNEPLKEQIENIRKPLNHAVERTKVQTRMLRQLLEASSIQLQNLHLDKKHCNLYDIVHRTVEEIHLTRTDRIILLHLPAVTDIPVYADEDRIGQVIMDFLSNALKYSKSAQPVIVRLAQEGTQARVSVSDKGPGLSLKDQEHIWERFYQVPDVERQYGTSTNGLGLGLYISRSIIEQHHGEVGVHSIPGEGSTFWFTLPIKRKHEH